MLVDAILRTKHNVSQKRRVKINHNLCTKIAGFCPHCLLLLFLVMCDCAQKNNEGKDCLHIPIEDFFDILTNVLNIQCVESTVIAWQFPFYRFLDNAVAKNMWSNMYWILILLFNFQQTKAQLAIYDAEMQAVDSKSLIIQFRIGGNQTGLLTGDFFAYHEDCPWGNCGSSTYLPPLVSGTLISIRANLSPCTKPLKIEVKSFRNDIAGWYYSHKLEFTNTGRIFHHIYITIYFHPRQSFLC